MKSLWYHAPTSIGDGVALLADNDGRACQFCGGMDEIARILKSPGEVDLVVNVSGLSELHVLDVDRQRGLTLGAAVPWCRVANHPALAGAYACLSLVSALIRSLPDRKWATVGGSVCASPAESDAIAPLVALGARCNLVSAQGERVVPLESCYSHQGDTLLGQGALLVSIQVPAPQPHSGAWYLPFYAVPGHEPVHVRVAASVMLSEDHSRIIEARVTLGAASPAPLSLESVSALLAGQAPSKEALNAAATLARVAAWPKPASEDAIHRARVAGLMTRHALMIALSRAKQSSHQGSGTKYADKDC